MNTFFDALNAAKRSHPRAALASADRLRDELEGYRSFATATADRLRDSARLLLATPTKPGQEGFRVARALVRWGRDLETMEQRHAEEDASAAARHAAEDAARHRRHAKEKERATRRYEDAEKRHAAQEPLEKSREGAARKREKEKAAQLVAEAEEELRKFREAEAEALSVLAWLGGPPSEPEQDPLGM